MAIRIMAIFAVLFMSAGATIAAWFVTNASVTALAAQLLLVAGVFQIFDGVQITSAGALRGFEDTRGPMLIGILSYWLVGASHFVFLRVQTRVRTAGIWFGFVMGLALAATALVARLFLRVKRA